MRKIQLLVVLLFSFFISISNVHAQETCLKELKNIDDVSEVLQCLEERIEQSLESRKNSSEDKYLPEQKRSLLFGKVEAHGTSGRSCRPTRAKGSLTMSIHDRSGDFAMCCVNQFPAVELEAGDEVLATIDLQQPEKQFEVKVETEDKHLYLHNRSLKSGSHEVSLAITNDRLGGNQSLRIIKFCIAAVGKGIPQTVNVESAIVHTP